MKIHDAISGAAFVVLAGMIFWFTRDFRQMPGQDYGAGFFPRLIATAMAGLGIVLILQSAIRQGAGGMIEVADWMRSPRHVSNALVVIAALIFYILVSDRLGFIVTGFICLGTLLIWLRGLRHAPGALVIAAVSVVCLQAFFGHVLRVPLPWGVLQAWSF